MVGKRYDLLLKLQAEGCLTSLVASGIIPVSVATWYEIYKHYLSELIENQKVLAIQFTADQYEISESNLYRIIRFMEN